jgi:hypothetical protein
MGHCGEFGWLCAMGHCCEFGNVLWAPVANLVMHHGLLRQIWLCIMGPCVERSFTVKICDNFCEVGDNARFNLAIWAMVQDFVMFYGPQHWILLLLWAIAQDFVLSYGP